MTDIAMPHGLADRLDYRRQPEQVRRAIQPQQHLTPQPAQTPAPPPPPPAPIPEQAQVPAQTERDAPQQGVEAHNRILDYGHDLAQYVEGLGDEHAMRAEIYRNDCYSYAAEIRIKAELEATRALRYTRRVDTIGMALEEARRLHSEEDL